MTEQQWLDRTLSPTECCNPHAIRQQRAIYQGWISTMPREPGEQPKDESTKEQKQQNQRWEENRSREAEKLQDKYWGPNGPN